MVPAATPERVPGLVVHARFRAESAEDAATLIGRLRDAVDILSGFPGFQEARIGRATDDGLLILLSQAWDSVGAYRRALSSFEVKVSVVPLLSTALDEPSAFEAVYLRDGKGAAEATGSLAADAATVSLGEASAPYVPPMPS